MIIRAYDEMYLDGAMHKLAEMMEFAVLDEGMNLPGHALTSVL